MPCYIPRRFPRYLEARPKRRRILVGSVRICLTWPRVDDTPCALLVAPGLRRRHSQCRAVVDERAPRCTGIAQTIVRPRSNACASACPIGALGWRQAQTGGPKSEWKDKRRTAGPRPGTNRMNSSPDRTSSPTLPPAVRELAALCEYSEGSHEANARQRNPGRGVARRTG